MANTTARVAKTLHGTNPQFLIERVIRGRIYDSMYWKEHCFALTAESLVDQAISLTYIGGTFGIQKPTAFLCLVCKLLQIQPDKQIVMEYLSFKEFKYLRAIAAMYVRLAFSSLEVYEILEPMLEDYRRLRFRQMSGNYHITYMDEFVNDLLTKERVCELILPRLTKRIVLEESEGLAPRISKLEDALLVTSNQDDKDGDSADSDDSAAVTRKEKMDRLKKAQRVREDREAQELSRIKTAQNLVLEDRREDQLEEEIASQEESDGYVSRSPSRSGSEGGYRSRSPSRSPDRKDGYLSRSVSRSPDRA
jgi:pre-mRNA-splicing factor 38A